MSAGRDLTDPARALHGMDLEGGMKAPTFENIEIPERFGPVTVQVDEWKVKRFAFTQDDFHPWYFGASPFRKPLAHAALLANDLLQMFTTRYAASQVVGLHTEEEFWFDRPVFVGDTVTLEAEYAEAFERRGQGHVVMEARAVDPEGHSLVRHRGIEIMRTVPGSIAGRASVGPGTSRRPITGTFDRDLPTVTRLGNGSKAGMRLAPIQKEITQEQMSVFSRCGEYVRNIHNDLAIAQEGGLDRPIVQGQQLFCHLVELLADRFGPPWFEHGWVLTKFLRPVLAFERVQVSGVVQSVHDPDAEGTFVDVDVWVRNREGELAVVGWGRCLAPKTPTQALLE